MDRKMAKEFLHLREWLRRAGEIVESGRDRCDSDELLQEAGDSLMMKIGAAANRLSRVGVVAPKGVEWNSAIGNRNWLIHQYDEINRELTWLTLSRDLPEWKRSLEGYFAVAEVALGDGGESPPKG